MRQRVSQVFTITTSLPTLLSRQEELPTPIIAKFLHSRVAHSPDDVFAAKLKVDMLSGPRKGDTLPAWDLIHVDSAMPMSHVEDGWCIFQFDAFDGRPAVLHLDCPKERFEFRLVVEFYVMRERKQEDLDVSVRQSGRIEYIGSCASPPILVDT